MRPTIYHLIGMPGVGKYTTAKELVALTGAKLVDNHAIANVIFNLLDGDGVTPLPREVWQYVGAVRRAALDTMMNLSPPHLSFILTNVIRGGDAAEYAKKLDEARRSHHLAPKDPVLFLEVRPGDASDFSQHLRVQGVTVDGFRVLRTSSPAIPNAIAGVLLDLRDRTYSIPHAYFGWTEGNPLVYVLKFLALGEGDTAPVCREVLRKAEPNPERRPRIHLG